MKLQILLTATLLACTTLGVLAQDKDKKRKEIGFIVGLQRSNLDYNSIITTNVAEEAKTSIGGSFFLNSRLIGHFITLRTELGFYSKGGTYTGAGAAFSETNLSYVAALHCYCKPKLAF